MVHVRTAGKLGYCSGVSQAIEKAIEYGNEHGKVYSLGTVAHNEHVVALLRQHGVEPLSPEDLADVTWVAQTPTYVVITAHGAPPELYEKIEQLHCHSLDCTCPIVKKAQDTVRNLAADGYDIVIFGDREHQEVKGIVGWSMGSCKFVGHQNQLFTPGQEHKELNLGPKVGVVSQTTKNPSDYRDFISTLVYHHIDQSPDVRICNTICPIVTKRIEETRNLSAVVDMMFVVGSQESANTSNLADVARPGVGFNFVYIVQDTDQIGAALSDWYVENEMTVPRVGVTGGTSTPIEVVQEIVTKLKELLYEHEDRN